MRLLSWNSLALLGVAHAIVPLENVCTPAYVVANLPAGNSASGLSINTSSVTAVAVYNESISGAIFDFCDLNFAYSHIGRNDQVLVNYWLPTPANFQNRFLSTGGGGWNITSKNSSLPGGVEYGAVTGTTDGGFGGFDTSSDDVWLLADGEINWETITMLGYQGIYELSVIGKELTRKFYNMSDARLWSYFDGCSEGGREGWSQVQRYGADLDGAVIGAPGIRWSLQNVNHLWSEFAEYLLDYYPPYCELEQIAALTVSACDGFDGRLDGVVARTDLCKLSFNLNSTIGRPYSCSASAAITGFMPAIPVQNGTISAQGVAVAQKILDGAKDSAGRQVYLSYQPSAIFQDAVTTYNTTTRQYSPFMNIMSAEWVELGVRLLQNRSLTNFDGVTADTFRDWMATGRKYYGDALETTRPDLTPFAEAGGKVIHYHGESDPQVPTASSVRYWESVRNAMYPELTYNQSSEALKEWYRLFLIPGAGHCGRGTQPGPFPEDTLATLIDWVENGIDPVTLNGSVNSGQYSGEVQSICSWPLRPHWMNNGTTMECQFNQESITTWMWDLDAWSVTIY